MNKRLMMGGGVLVALLLWLLSQETTSAPAKTVLVTKPAAVTPTATAVPTAAATAATAAATVAVTQLGAPASVIAGLTIAQLQNDVNYWIDPASGTLIPNEGQLNGSVPLVALTDLGQITNFYTQNPQALQDLNAAASQSTAFVAAW